MADSKFSSTKDLSNLLDAIIDSNLSASDEEIVAELRERGHSLEDVDSAVKRAFLAAETRYKQGLRAAAQRQWELNTKNIENRSRLPSSQGERRSLFQKVFALLGPSGTGMLTMQHRLLTEYTDADIEQALAELANLGVLDEFNDELK